MTRMIVFGAAALLLFTFGVIAANTHVARGVIFPVTSYEADVNKDTRVNIADLGLVASKYGQTAPTATPVPVATATPTSYCNLSGRTFSALFVGIGLGGEPKPDFSDCRLVATQFTSRTALTSLLFRRADMRNVNLDRAQLDYSDFSNANLSGAVLTGITARTTSFASADLTNAVLSNGDITQNWPPGPPSIDAFNQADFTGAVTTGADVGGVIWFNTTCPDGTNSDNNGGSCIGHGFAGTPLPTYTPTATPTSTATPDTCVGASANARWTAGNGHCYQRFDGSLALHAAEADCESRGDHLVTLADAAEQDFVWSSVGLVNALIGFTDEAVEGTWIWVTGEPVGYTNWRAGEPNNGLGGPVEHAAQLTVIGGGAWNDLPVEEAFPYICETP